MNKLKLIFSFIVISFSISSYANETIKADHIQVSILAPERFAAGKKTVLGIRYVMDKEWHVYWKNPGDSGTAPKFKFSSKDADIGNILWPFPKRIPFGSLVNFGYEDSIVLPFEVTPKSGKNTLQIEVGLEWLVCDEGECIPGFGMLKLDRPVAAEEKWNEQDLADIQNDLSKVPRSSDQIEWKITRVERNKDALKVTVDGKGDVDDVDLFPIDGDSIKPQIPTKNRNANGIEFIFGLQAGLGELKEVGFVLTNSKISTEWLKLAVHAGQFETVVADPKSLLILLFSAFIGGIILNFMPCVLPVLSIKFISISQTPSSERLKDALLYTAGVIVTFAALGGIFLILRSAGTSVGWGFQLQSPLVVFALILLFWLMALNFLGFFELGTSIMNMAGRSSHSGAFAAGVLSVFVAAPCTGPFMGTALGAAATLPAHESLLIFTFLGLGLAFPFLLVAVSPRMRQLIPPPGAWMEKLKEFFAFPLIATVIWLLWVLHLQVGTNALPLSLGILMLLSFFIWFGKHFEKAKILLWILAILSIFYAGKDFHNRLVESTGQNQASKIWKPFNPAQIEDLRAQGKAVFIDYTAAWCITCQVNKKAVLRTHKIEKLFQEKEVVLFEADWTKQDPVITESLAKLGRNSVPVYVFYPAKSQETKILPQILTPSDIEGLF